MGQITRSMETQLNGFTTQFSLNRPLAFRPSYSALLIMLQRRVFRVLQLNCFAVSEENRPLKTQPWLQMLRMTKNLTKRTKRYRQLLDHQ